MGLVLARYVGESIDIGPDIRITVAELKGIQVKIIIDAPKGLRITRPERDEVRTQVHLSGDEG